METAIAKVFISGNSQAIRLPKEFRLDTTAVCGLIEQACHGQPFVEEDTHLPLWGGQGKRTRQRVRVDG